MLFVGYGWLVEKGGKGALNGLNMGWLDVVPADVWVVGHAWTCVICRDCCVLGSLGEYGCWPEVTEHL
jgi:hypothetical protein